jgi:hypothetical protein
VILADLAFTASLIEWRGPAPFVFAPVPADLTGEIRFAAHEASYGWGCVPVSATVGGTAFTTSLFPRDGGYLLPVKVAVQKAESIGVGDEVAVTLVIAGR